MTTEHEATRTLVKSPPELWAECSDPGSLARHLGEFGEIRITRLEPETTVAWEGEHVSGMVRIEPSAWGTRVTLTAEPKAEEGGERVEEPGDPPAAALDSKASLDTPSDPVTDEAQPTRDDVDAGEVDDRPPEATLPDVSAAGTADPAPLRIRWRRMSARIRAPFRRTEREKLTQAQPEQSAVDEEPMGADAVQSSAIGADAVQRSLPERELVSDSPAGQDVDADAILSAALESLGQAHHRPFSRA